MKKGIDISYHQGNVDFAKVKDDGIDFIILREGYGNRIDKRFLEYVQKAKEIGIKIFGVYHFSYALNIEGAIKEAENCIENVKKAGLGNEVMIFYDFEYDTVKKAFKKGVKLTKKDCVEYTIAFCEEVKRMGFIPGVYTNLDYYKHWYDDRVLKKYNIWLADYSGSPDFECLLQQYTSKGNVSGIKEKVDLNYYFGKESHIQEVSKDKDLIAQEVIFGLWGNGSDRKKALWEAGFTYSEIQKKVNEILNGPAKNTTNNISKKISAKCYAKNFDPIFSGDYLTSTDLYCRDGAGTSKIALCVIPKGMTVCSYGYYTVVNGVKWFLISFTLNGIEYKGFSSSKYLKKVT